MLGFSDLHYLNSNLIGTCWWWVSFVTCSSRALILSCAQNMDITRFFRFYNFISAFLTQFVHPSVWSLKASPLEITLQVRFKVFAYLQVLLCRHLYSIGENTASHSYSYIFKSAYYRLLEFSSEKKTESEKQNIEMPFNYKLRQKQV